MPNRILKESICASPDINLLTAEEEIFFYRLIVNCDDYGLADARAEVLISKCFPLRLYSVTPVKINAYLKKFAQIGLIILYKAEGRPYLKLAKWENHQQVRAKKAKYPMPSDDNICNQLISDDNNCPRNPIQSESNPNPMRAQNGFARFWEAYPKKRSKGDAEKAWDTIKLSEPLVNQVIAKLKLAKTSADWTKDDGKYIPYPATWLRAKGWEDDYSKKPELNSEAYDRAKKCPGHDSPERCGTEVQGRLIYDYCSACHKAKQRL